jgi:hypothetical protein
MNSKGSNPVSKPVEAILPDKSIVQGTFLLWNEDPVDKKKVHLVLKLLGKEFSSSNLTFFGSLRDIRTELEQDGILLKCYGSSRQVWPSGMGLSMGHGSRAYKTVLGKKGDIKDVVSIFDSGDDCEPCTFEEQKQFHQQWLASIGTTPGKKIIPWKNLFIQQPVSTLKLALKEKFRKTD